MTSRRTPPPVYIVQRSAFSDWQDMRDFTRELNHPNVDLRSDEVYQRVAAEGGGYLIRDSKEALCMMAMLIRHYSEDGELVGQEAAGYLNKGPHDYNFARTLTCAMLADCAMEARPINIFARMYFDCLHGIRVFTDDVLQFEQSSPSEKLLRAQAKTRVDSAIKDNERESVCYQFNPINIGNAFRHLAEIRTNEFRYNKQGEKIELDIRRWDTQAGTPSDSVASPYHTRIHRGNKAVTSVIGRLVPGGGSQTAAA